MGQNTTQPFLIVRPQLLDREMLLLLDEVEELGRDVAHRQDKVGKPGADGAAGHGRVFSFSRILDENDAACLLDSLHAYGPIGAGACQDDSAAISMLCRKRAEE